MQHAWVVTFLLSLVAFPTLAREVYGPGFHFTSVGSEVDAKVRAQRGIALLGGGSVTGDRKIYEWMIERARGGDFLVRGEEEGIEFNHTLFRFGGLSSVSTAIVTDRRGAYSPLLLDRVRRAEVIFFKGGDQHNYDVRLRNTPLLDAILRRVRDGVVLGGTSAGMAIMGESIFTAEHDTLFSDEALADPFTARLTLRERMFPMHELDGIILDTHFGQRDRLGRMLAFLARLSVSPRGLRHGIGIDANTALLIDARGPSRVLGLGCAYFLSVPRPPEVCSRGKPLTFHDVEVQRVCYRGAFDLARWRTADGVEFRASVEDGKIRASIPEPYGTES